MRVRIFVCPLLMRTKCLEECQACSRHPKSVCWMTSRAVNLCGSRLGGKPRLPLRSAAGQSKRVSSITDRFLHWSLKQEPHSNGVPFTWTFICRNWRKWLRQDGTWKCWISQILPTQTQLTKVLCASLFCSFFQFLATSHSMQDRGLPTRDWNCASHCGSTEYNHWTTREVQIFFSFLLFQN